MATFPSIDGDFEVAASTGAQDDFVLRIVTAEDWQAYRDYYKGLKDPHHFSDYLEGQNLDDPETYQRLFDATIHQGLVMFGMWHGGKMIGQSSIGFFNDGQAKTALLAGSEIADDYRGQRLVNRFYDARLQYLKDIQYEGRVITTINPDNTRSQKAAVRNGFEFTGQMDPYGYKVYEPAKPQEEAKIESKLNLKPI